MTLFDFILLVILFGFIWSGFWTGLIRAFGAIVGVFAGAFLAGYWYDEVGGWVGPFVGQNELARNIIGFIIVFLVVSQLIGVVFIIINKVFNIFTVIPGLKLINRLGGAILGFIEGTLAIGITLQFVSRLPISQVWADRLADSAVVAYFASLTGWLVPLFPQALESLKSIVS